MRRSLTLVSVLAALALAATAMTTPVQAAARPVAAPKARTAPSLPARPEMSPRLERSVDCARARCVALTFDDGPGVPTATLLDTLDSLDARATFFVLGKRARLRPDVVRRTARDGHEVGNHGWSHRDLTRLDRAAASREVARTGRLVRRLTGTRPRLLRPPYGATSAGVTAVARSAGMPQVMWSVDPRDWERRHTATVVRRVLDAATRGSIVLLHDIHPTTVAAVPRIVRQLRARGYTLVTVSELRPDMRPGQIYRSR